MSETTAKVMKKKPMHKGGKKGMVKRMIMERAGNGLTSTMQHEPDGDEDGSWKPAPETTMIHPTMAHAVKHMKANMGDAYPKGGDTDGGPANPGDGDDAED